jgi:hypothetical protein
VAKAAKVKKETVEKVTATSKSHAVKTKDEANRKIIRTTDQNYY